MQNRDKIIKLLNDLRYYKHHIAYCAMVKHETRYQLAMYPNSQHFYENSEKNRKMLIEWRFQYKETCAKLHTLIPYN